MAQLYHKYGIINSGKTIEILKVTHNCEEQGKPIVIMTSAFDTRGGYGVVSSRIGTRRKAVAITEEMDVFTSIQELLEKPYCVLVDGCQFLTKKHVHDLARVVDDLDVPVMAFRLRNDFQDELFEDSKYLLLLADKIDEIKIICRFCSKEVTMVLRTENGKPVYEGNQIRTGDDEIYIPVCREHYFNPMVSEEKQENEFAKERLIENE